MPRRRLALAGAVLGPVALVAWLPLGPLGPAWARRSGTPQALLIKSSPLRPATTDRGAAAASGGLHAPFSAHLAGGVRQGQTSAGLAVVDMALRMSGGASGSLDIRLQGQPLPGGGISLTGSRVTLGPSDEPEAYRGTVVSLQGNQLLATFTGGGDTLRLDASVQIDRASGTIQGTVSVGAGQ